VPDLPPQSNPPSPAPNSRGPDPGFDLEACSKRAIAGDPNALAELDRRLRPGLSRHFARKLAQNGPGGAGRREPGFSDRSEPPEMAQELAQQTFITFWKALEGGKYDPAKARLSTFLYAIAGNIWLRHRRAVGRAAGGQVGPDGQQIRPRRELSLDALEQPLADTGEAAAEALHQATELDIVRRVLAGLEPDSGLDIDERDVLRAIADGKSDRELASTLGVAPSTAHARKRSAMVKLRVFLSKRGFAPTPRGPEPGNLGGS
jgi:RNA polymerase sigma factor (sigma-70 family)